MIKKTIVLLVLLFLTSNCAFAASDVEFITISLDTVWVLVTAFLVFFMQAGFALVEAGFTRAKNTGNIIMKNLMDFSVGSLIFWTVGFALMFGDGNPFIGTKGFFLLDDFSNLGLGIPTYAFLIFQTVFAATAATIASGAMAERTKFTGYLIYSVVISALIYPVVGHWIWGGGWLSALGMIDFAGSTVVHSVGAWAGLAGAIVLGPRIGKYNKDGTVNNIPGHNLVIATLGVFILWFGWFGFNPGSTLSGTDPSIGLIAVTTNLAAAAGATGAMIVSWLNSGRPDVGMTLNGVLGGLVAITAGTASVDPLGAVIIGFLAGGIVVYGVKFFDKLHVDDPVGAVTVHGLCGVFGTLAVGLFAVEGGLFYGGSAELLGIQFIGVLSVFVWTFAAAYVLFKAVDVIIGLRVSREEEIQGLDKSEHRVNVYPDFLLVAEAQRFFNRKSLS
jgi:Amt family ammonium transporter